MRAHDTGHGRLPPLSSPPETEWMFLLEGSRGGKGCCAHADPHRYRALPSPTSVLRLHDPRGEKIKNQSHGGWHTLRLSRNGTSRDVGDGNAATPTHHQIEDVQALPATHDHPRHATLRDPAGGRLFSRAWKVSLLLKIWCSALFVFGDPSRRFDSQCHSHSNGVVADLASLPCFPQMAVKRCGHGTRRAVSVSIRSLEARGLCG